MDISVKSQKSKIDKRGRVRLPAAVVQECGMDNGVEATMYYGKNYSCIIIVPTTIEIGNRDMQERIRILVSNELGK